MVAIRQVLVRAKPKALVSRSCHLMSAILRLYKVFVWQQLKAILAI
jgi:hypothetical protein